MTSAPPPSSLDPLVTQDEEDDVPEDVTRNVAGRHVLRGVIEWTAVILGSLVIALVVRTFLFANYWIPSASMHPTLFEDQRVVVNKLSYRLHDVHRGDIIVFHKPPGEPESEAGGQPVDDYIKRVVGLPGETVSLSEGDVYIDGRRLIEPYLAEGTETVNLCEPTRTSFEVPEDEVFVMGDNRGNSRDSRCFEGNSIEEDSIVGRAFLRIWPLSEISGL